MLGGDRVEPAGEAGGAAYVLLVHPHVERAVAQQHLPGPRHAAEDDLRLGAAVGRRVGHQPVVRRSCHPAELGDDLRRRELAAVDHADLGVEPHEAGDVRRLADLGGLLGVAGQDALEVGGVRGDRAHVPAGQVGRRRPLLGRHLLEHRDEVVDRAPPHLDVAGQSLLIAHVGHPIARAR